MSLQVSAGVSLLTASLLLAAPLSAHSEAEVVIGQGRVALHVAASGGGHFLRVSGPGGYYEESRFAAEEVPHIDLFGPTGQPLADGTYRWELRSIAELRRRGEGVPLDAAVHTGVFSVIDGALADPTAPERSPLKDDVVADDQIVQGSECVGLSCVDGENFGFDVLRLKEFNVRIHMEDVSTAVGFPSNDWRITINDLTNGGANYFAIDDATADRTVFQIDAGAPGSSLHVVSQGDVGLGTSTPGTKLHLVNGNSPALRLEQEGSLGFSPQSWDVVGNETNFFVRDVTHGNTLPFRVRAGAPGDSLFIAQGGDVGLGTDQPGARLDVRGDIVLTGTVDGRAVAADGAALDAHIASLNNPHNVTAAQLGAEPAGTAMATVAAHQATFNHANLPSALPVPLTEGGTGATDAATARANLGLVESKAGLVDAADFSPGATATATVTFATPYPAGTYYAVLLTAVTDLETVTFSPTAISVNETGFTITLGGPSNNLLKVSWLTRPVGE
jgi:hypothetical protein